MPLGPAWVSRIFADRRAQAVVGIAALAFVALALGVPLSTLFLFGIILFCPLMMLGMHGMHGGHQGHAGGHDAVAAGEGGVQGDRALDILRERYARGELAREQYEEMRRQLG